MFESSHGRRPGPLLYDASASAPPPSRPVAPLHPVRAAVDGGFDQQLAEGPSGPAAITLLLGARPEALSRTMAISGAVGVEKAIRLLQAQGIRYTAVAAATRPAKNEIDDIVDELTAALDQHPQTSAAKVATARGIARRLPTTLARLAAGEISLHQATRIEHALRDLDATTAQTVEADAVPGNPRRLWRRLENALARHAPDHVKHRDEKRRAHREAAYWSDPADGTAGIGIQGPLELIAQLKAAIDSTAKVRTAGDDRPIGARRFDVLHHWARRTLGLPPVGTDRTGREHECCGTCGRSGRSGWQRIPITVTASIETLLRLNDTAGDLNGLPISAEAVRSLAADGRWRRFITEATGKLLDVGAATYVPNEQLARHVRGRDRTCRFPSCDQPADDCDLDHILSFSMGGKTTEINLGPLCRRHHRLKHEKGWTYARLPDGTSRWTSPRGRVYDQEPEEFADDPILSGLLAQASARERARKEKQSRSKPSGTVRRTADWNNPPDANNPVDDDSDAPF